MPDPLDTLARSRALWNRRHLDLRSDETLAQIIDRGAVADWSALYALMAGPQQEAATMRERVYQLLHRVPTAYPWLWLAALQSLGHAVDWSSAPREDPGLATI
jgi:hypothetical protein